MGIRRKGGGGREPFGIYKLMIRVKVTLVCSKKTVRRVILFYTTTNYQKSEDTLNPTHTMLGISTNTNFDVLGA